MFEGLGRYKTIVADPPWQFATRSPKGITKKGAGGQYETMSWTQLADLPVAKLADVPAVLLLWTSAPNLPLALDVMRVWGFAYKSRFSWRKMTKSGKIRVGTGYRVRSCHEDILIGTIGTISTPAVPSIFDGIAREHSRKPDEFWDLLRDFPQPMVELFSREERSVGEHKVDTWGHEKGKFG